MAYPANAGQKGPLPKWPNTRKAQYQKDLVQKGPLQTPVQNSCFHKLKVDCIVFFIVILNPEISI